MIKLPDTIEQPALPSNLPNSAHWLAGEGAGSWFVLISSGKPYQYHISRYSPEGKLECSGVFQSEHIIDIENDFKVTYPSHCQIVTVIQDGAIIRCQNISGPPQS